MMASMNEATRARLAQLLQIIYSKKYIQTDGIPCKIEEGLFLGSLGAAVNKDVLKSLNVTHILTVANSLQPEYPNDFVYKKIDVTDKDTTNITQHFEECFNFIDEAKKMGGSVLVHCFAGRSRSVTIVVAYLMKKHHMSLHHALELVRSKRPQASPNYGFFSQLKKFESLLGVNEEVKNEQPEVINVMLYHKLLSYFLVFQNSIRQRHYSLRSPKIQNTE